MVDVKDLLRQNRETRERAERELADAREQLREYLQKGHEAGLGVSEMARLAGIGRAGASRIIWHGKSYVSKDAA